MSFISSNGRVVFRSPRVRTNRGNTQARRNWQHKWSYSRSCPQSTAYPIAAIALIIRGRVDMLEHKLRLNKWQRLGIVRGARRVRLAK